MSDEQLVMYLESISCEIQQENPNKAKILNTISYMIHKITKNQDKASDYIDNLLDKLE